MSKELSQETLQHFSDQVADICEQMELTPEWMLECIGSTYIGAVLSFGKTDHQVEIPDVAIAKVDTIFEQTDGT